MIDADAIVVGAGAAGLAAARELARRSKRVLAIEARDRIGGRVRWASAPQGALPGELGAEFIHGPAPETMALLREAGMLAVETGGNSWVRDDRGDLQRHDDDFIEAASLFEAAGELPHDESVERFLRRFGERDAYAVAAARTFVEGFEAADPAIASVRAIAAEIRSGTDATARRPVGGYRPMFDYLREACDAAGVRTMLATRARAIRWQGEDVEVDVLSSEGARTLRARCAIVTLPAGVLRARDGDGAVTFEPPLPPEKTAALAGIEMGCVVKAVLRFSNRFWETLRDGRYRDAGFFRANDGRFLAYWTQLPAREPLVVAWAGGPRAAALRGRDERDLIALAIDEFASYLGTAGAVGDAFEEGTMHDWDGDPFARGAYSYVAVGSEAARAALATPLAGKLFFAGEACSTDGQGGTVNGALATGKRAAGEAAAVLGAMS